MRTTLHRLQLRLFILSLFLSPFLAHAIDSYGCSTIPSVTIPNAFVLGFTASATPASCIASEDGTITVTPSGGASPYQYSKDNGGNYQSSNVFTGLAVGSYSVVVKDANEQVAEQQIIDIQFEDLIPPIVITQDVTIHLNGTGVASVTAEEINNGTTDACGIATLVLDQADFDCSSVGENTITLIATDVNGNESTATATVTVVDDMSPTITPGASITVSADENECSANVDLIDPVVSDNCNISTLISDYPSPIFPVGGTLITWTVTDVNGNSNTATQLITVIDNEPPIIMVEDVFVDNTPGLCTAEVNLGDVHTGPTIVDNCSIESITNDYPGGSIFPVGETIVTWTVVDIHGNETTAQQLITVTDIEIPGIAAVTDIILSTDPRQCSADMLLTVPATSDNCGVAEITSDYPSSSFPVGETTITWTVIDINGNTNFVEQNITVNDTESPAFEMPQDVEAENTFGSCSAIVELITPNAFDNCELISVTNDHESLLYPVGETMVTWTATDINGNSSTATQKIIVHDTDSPEIAIAEDIVVSNDAGQCAAQVFLLAPSATDNCGVASVTSDNPTSLFPVGESVVTWTATDIHGNTSSTEQKVIVTDGEAPAIVAPEDVTVVASAGCAAEVILETPAASDNCSDIIMTNDHPSNIYPTGTTIVTWTATDEDGNTATATQNVIVTGGGSDGEIVIKYINPSKLLLPVMSPVALKVEFKGNAEKAMVDWGDGFEESIPINSSPFTIKHSYQTPGVHVVKITLSNACGTSKPASYEYIVSFDPEDGYVAGSGWINSPSDACSYPWKNSSKAIFGFVSKYEKGFTQPNGETQFHFIAGNINFVSLSYTYLKASENKAHFKGTGTINGTGIYEFQITAVDGKKDKKKKSSDKFRIRITQGHRVIYDNQRGDNDWDNCRESTAVDGGAIEIYIPEKKKNLDWGGDHIIAKRCEAYPNPMRSFVSVHVDNQNQEPVALYLMDMAGRTLLLKQLPSAEEGVYHLDTEHLASGTYFLRVHVGTSNQTLKLLKE